MANNTRTNDVHIDHVVALLDAELPNTTEALKRDLSGLLEGQRCVLERRISAQAKLYTERQRLRHPKDKELTDWDRKILLDEATSAAQMDYEWILGIEKALEQRIGIIQTLLSC